MKVSRQTKILELIAENEIETQEELARLLNESGYNVTQATVSRDLRELKLTKVTVERGRQKYIELQQPRPENKMIDKYVRILQNGFVSVDNAMNIIVIRTVAGMAMAVAAAIDDMNWHEVVGCIAGDDTIMCAIRTVEDAEVVMEKFRRIVISDGRYPHLI